MKIKHIDSILYPLTNGITLPLVATDDDKEIFVVKVYNGECGNLILFNEYFCYRLAILLDIKMPISGVCLIDEKTNDDNFLVTQKKLWIWLLFKVFIKNVCVK